MQNDATKPNEPQNKQVGLLTITTHALITTAPLVTILRLFIGSMSVHLLVR
jgi:hypothetical protein